MSTDPELDLWRSQWRAGEHAMPDFAVTGKSVTARVRIKAFLEPGVVLIASTILATWSIVSQQTARAIQSTLTGLLLLQLLILTRKDDSNWSGKAPNTYKFLVLLRRRGRTRLLMAKAGLVLCMVQSLSWSVWIYQQLTGHWTAPLGPLALLVPNLAAWIVTAACMAWVVRYSRAKKAELAQISSILRDFESFSDEYAEAVRHSKENHEPRLAEAMRKLRTMVLVPVQRDSLDWRLRNKRKPRKV
jgi:hypothetical protein